MYESGRERPAGGPGGREQDRDQECQVSQHFQREYGSGQEQRLHGSEPKTRSHNYEPSHAQCKSNGFLLIVARGQVAPAVAHHSASAGCLWPQAYRLTADCVRERQDNGILARTLDRNWRTRALRPLWPKPPSDRATHHPATRTVAGIVPMEPSDLMNCKKRAQKDVPMSSHARKYGEAGTPLNTSSCDRVAPAILRLRAWPAAPWPRLVDSVGLT